jgi:hypothetical protein
MEDVREVILTGEPRRESVSRSAEEALVGVRPHLQGTLVNWLGLGHQGEMDREGCDPRDHL